MITPEAPGERNDPALGVSLEKGMRTSRSKEVLGLGLNSKLKYTDVKHLFLLPIS